jgi:diguanylate cyclase (GGDEF)-like protein
MVTGLSNRLAIIAEIEVEQSRSHRTKSAFSIAIFSVDHFEQVTDTHGHYAGDAMLKWVAAVIRKNIRPYDKIGRYGGEEFLLMMPHATEKEALIIAERARKAIQKLACVVEGRQIGVTVTIGVAVGERGADLDSVLFAAAAATSRAKDQGRNCTVVAPSIGTSAEGQGAIA